ncbi:MAG: flagellar motor protein MotB [Magnetococcales bacterium]|nr:flagellar motor protein MotB [Magnetococcales bacterium]
MSSKKCPVCKKGTPLWFISWADMATLLLCFFVIIVAYSTVEITKFKELAGTFKDQFGVQRIEKISPIMSSQNLIGSEFQQEIHLVELRDRIRVLSTTLIDNGQAEVEEKQEGFLLRIREDALLAPDGKKVSEANAIMLDQIANLLAKERNVIEIRGHTDAQPKGGDTIESTSWFKGATMAIAVAKRLAASGGVAPERLVISTNGEYSPVADNRNPEARKANRRIEILIRKDIAGFLPKDDSGDKRNP